MLIEEYEFGKIVIDGETYYTDVLVFPDRVRDQWWRRKGHELGIEDIKCVLAAQPEVLIVGTGYTGALRIPEETQRQLSKHHIQLIVKKTQAACSLFNSMMQANRNVVSALHLTC
ncbi:MAG: Mth938-like domain-containing protein [Promethearchaeota archaeon]